MDITKSTEWEGDKVRLVRLGGLKRHANFPFNSSKRSRYYKREKRRIEWVIAHQLAGPFRGGVDAAKGLARFATAEPKRNAKGKLIGGGRGWPGCPYTFLVPYYPDVVDGKLEVYRLWDDPWVTWHTGRGWNQTSVAVGFGGMLATRHSPKWSSSHARDPDLSQFVAGTELITDYLLPRYGISPRSLRGHHETGKPTCPGDVIEAWVRHQRGEKVTWLESGRALWLEGGGDVPVANEDPRPLDSWRDRQQALVDLGYFLGTSGPNEDGVDGAPGYYTRAAVKAFQASEGCVSDGIWGDQTERAVRIALAVS